jgi:hypothetical protein
VKPISFFKILGHNRSEWRYILLGCFGSFTYGSAPFLYGLIMGRLFEVSNIYLITYNKLLCLLNHPKRLEACTVRGRGSISKVEGHWPKGALLYMTKIKRFYVVHEPNENF